MLPCANCKAGCVYIFFLFNIKPIFKKARKVIKYQYLQIVRIFTRKQENLQYSKLMSLDGKPKTNIVFLIYFSTLHNFKK